MNNKVLYALITRRCNLTCPHCDVYNLEDNYDEKAFLDQLLKFDGEIILFGGEPTMYPRRLFNIVDTCDLYNKKIRSISTNLTVLNEKLIDLYKKIGSVATSWNPYRFDNIQYEMWYHNCNWLSKATGIRPALLITMDNDLLNMGVDNFLKVIDDWDSSMFKGIKLEYYNGYNKDNYFNQVDEFLCELHSKWRSDIYNDIVDRVKHWWHDCSGVYTLNPNGIIHHRCPHNMPPTVPNECYTCDRVDICRPCVLQQQCSFPKKFSQLIESEGDKLK